MVVPARCVALWYHNYDRLVRSQWGREQMNEQQNTFDHQVNFEFQIVNLNRRWLQLRRSTARRWAENWNPIEHAIFGSHSAVCLIMQINQTTNSVRGQALSFAQTNEVERRARVGVMKF